MNAIIQVFSCLGIFIVPVVIFGVRIEHRLTKIETDVNWLKHKMNEFCEKGH